jgi:methionine-rich copper-binding protein CopC
LHLAKLLAFASFLVIAAAWLVPGAAAHSRPVRFDPSPGEVLTSSPDTVTGWFTSDIRRVEESFIRVIGPDGANAASEEVDLSEDRRQMSVAIDDSLAVGRYVVHWSTFDDADGEVFSDCYAFFVGQAAADDALEHGHALDTAADCPAETASGSGDATDDDHAHDDDASTVESSASVDFRVIVNGKDAELTILPIDFTPRAPDGNTVDPNFGHYHIYLDEVPVDAFTGAHSHDDAESHDDMAMDDDDDEAHDDDMAEDMAMDDESTDGHAFDGGLVENPAMVIENSFLLTDLEPGVHTVSVVLNYDNHAPFDPPVIATQTFEIEGDSGGIPAWTLVLAIAGGLVVGGIGMKLAGSRS